MLHIHSQVDGVIWRQHRATSSFVCFIGWQHVYNWLKMHGSGTFFSIFFESLTLILVCGARGRLGRKEKTDSSSAYNSTTLLECS